MIVRIFFISVFLIFSNLVQATTLDIQVILPKEITVVPLEFKNMLQRLKYLIPAPVSKVLQNKLILDFSQKTGKLNIQCPSDLIFQHNQSLGISDEDSTFESGYLTSQYVEITSFIYNWSSFPFQLMRVHKGFLDISTALPSCYQVANYFSAIDYLEGQILRNIGKIWNQKAVPESDFLVKQSRLRQFSDSSLFSHLDNWGSGSVAHENKNIWEGDSLDIIVPAVRISPLQNFSLEESFGIYFEKFLSDKSFACKKPATHMYFKKIMNFSPFGIEECENLNTKIYGGFLNKDVFNLDPSRIKEVHILLAGPGKAMMSRWGHTMFRLVVCAEGQSGSDCVANSFDDIVLGFRGYVGDIQINPIKGVFGKYPSLIFPANMADIKNEYNRTALRDLTSIPINFTQEEIKFFTYKALQDFWSYRGKYYFLTNNCATESNDFLMGSFLSNPKKSYLLHQLLGSTLTPTGSISDIKKAKSKSFYKGLKDTFDLTKLIQKNKKRQKFYVSSSYRPALKKLISLLVPQRVLIEDTVIEKNDDAGQLFATIVQKKGLALQSLPKFQQGNQVESFANLSIQKRVALYKRLLDKSPKYAISLTLLETYIKKDLEKSIKSNAISLAINIKNPGPVAQKVLEAFKKVTRSHIQVHAFNSYGVPSSAEVSQFLTKLQVEYKLTKSDMIDPEIELVEGAEPWNWEDELIERSEKLADQIVPEWSQELKEIENLLESLKVYYRTKTLSF